MASLRRRTNVLWELVGYDKVLEWLQNAEKELGPEFKPSAYLEKVVAERSISYKGLM